MSGLRDFIAGMPTCELHAHLDSTRSAFPWFESYQATSASL